MITKMALLVATATALCIGPIRAQEPHTAPEVTAVDAIRSIDHWRDVHPKLIREVKRRLSQGRAKSDSKPAGELAAALLALATLEEETLKEIGVDPKTYSAANWKEWGMDLRAHTLPLLASGWALRLAEGQLRKIEICGEATPEVIATLWSHVGSAIPKPRTESRKAEAIWFLRKWGEFLIRSKLTESGKLAVRAIKDGLSRKAKVRVPSSLLRHLKSQVSPPVATTKSGIEPGLEATYWLGRKNDKNLLRRQPTHQGLIATRVNDGAVFHFWVHNDHREQQYSRPEELRIPSNNGNTGEHVRLKARGHLELPRAGFYRLRMRFDDSAEIRINGELVADTTGAGSAIYFLRFDHFQHLEQQSTIEIDLVDAGGDLTLGLELLEYRRGKWRKVKMDMSH